jgi:hypothetical protein
MPGSGGGWIAVDLDGTLAFYDSWRGEDHIGDPIPTMVKRVQGWLAMGYEVRIFTARHGNGASQIALIEAWCERHLGVVLPVTATKDYAMMQLWDDRCVEVSANRGEPILADNQLREEIERVRAQRDALFNLLCGALMNGTNADVQAIAQANNIMEQAAS